MEAAKYNVLFCVPGKGPEQTQGLVAKIQPTVEKYIQECVYVKSIDEYNALTDEKKKSFTIIVLQLYAPHAAPILKDQVASNGNLKWVHTLSSGIDGFVAVEEFKNSPIPLTNAKSAFSSILGEFVALGVLYHTKHLERFMQRKAEKKWELEPMELVSTKSMAVIGYGDIGAACARIAKNGFGMKVWGVKRNPAECSDLHRSYCDEVVGQDQYERVIKEADFVVGVLPKVADTGDFFNMDSTFSKMKKTAVFMNIGRGPTVHEEDLTKALKDGVIGGAVLDVFKKEPLDTESELWSLPNVLLTPHCAQQDKEFMTDCIKQFAENLEAFHEGKPLNNLTDKQKGY